MREAGLVGPVAHALGLGVHGIDLVGRGALLGQGPRQLGESRVGVAQEDQAKTGVENSAGFRPVLAQSWSAAAHRRRSMATRSGAMGCSSSSLETFGALTKLRPGSPRCGERCAQGLRRFANVKFPNPAPGVVGKVLQGLARRGQALRHRVSRCVHVSLGDEPPGGTRLDQFSHAADIGGDRRPAHCKRFHDRDRQTFVIAAEHQRP